MLRPGFSPAAPAPRSIAAARAGFTLIELLILLAIFATLAVIGVPVLLRELAAAKETEAVEAIQRLESEILAYAKSQGKLPATLDDIGMLNLRDPWGNRYQYRPVAASKGRDEQRMDRFLAPINSDFDLYSMGADGKSALSLTAADSRDDIIRANDGGYFGRASEY